MLSVTIFEFGNVKKYVGIYIFFELALSTYVSTFFKPLFDVLGFFLRYQLTGRTSRVAGGKRTRISITVLLPLRALNR